jgi:uncharacterized membrane protein
MAHVHKSITIDRPAEELFHWIEEPLNLPRFVPHVERVADLHRKEGRVGESFHVFYKVLGATFDETFTITDHRSASRLVTSFSGGMSGTFAWSLVPKGSQTDVSVDVDYQLGGGPIGKAIDAIVLERTNEKTLEQMLENLKNIPA